MAGSEMEGVEIEKPGSWRSAMTEVGPTHHSKNTPTASSRTHNIHHTHTSFTSRFPSFACAICPHRPVLDTLAMLTAHRAGKKHLSSKYQRNGEGGRWRINNGNLVIYQALCFSFLLAFVLRSETFLWQKAGRQGNRAKSKTSDRVQDRKQN